LFSPLTPYHRLCNFWGPSLNSDVVSVGWVWRVTGWASNVTMSWRKRKLWFALRARARAHTHTHTLTHTHTPQHIKGGWPHNTDTSEPVVGYGHGAINMAFETATSPSLVHRANQLRYPCPQSWRGGGVEDGRFRWQVRVVNGRESSRKNRSLPEAGTVSRKRSPPDAATPRHQ
jgi:hypothetical protein